MFFWKNKHFGLLKKFKEQKTIAIVAQSAPLAKTINAYMEKYPNKFHILDGNETGSLCVPELTQAAKYTQVVITNPESFYDLRNMAFDLKTLFENNCFPIIFTKSDNFTEKLLAHNVDLELKLKTLHSVEEL